jgi:hypothetical protein
MLREPEPREQSDRACQGDPHGGRPCNLAATVHCVLCDLWFCDVHAEDEVWHACMLTHNDEGGEA